MSLVVTKFWKHTSKSVLLFQLDWVLTCVIFGAISRPESCRHQTICVWLCKLHKCDMVLFKFLLLGKEQLREPEYKSKMIICICTWHLSWGGESKLFNRKCGNYWTGCESDDKEKEGQESPRKGQANGGDGCQTEWETLQMEL